MSVFVEPASASGSPISGPALEEGLHRLGYAAFRPGQREAIETLLRVGRLLLVAPTGGGKSLTYQLPALLLRGTTLVISPLIALMHDQVRALGERGVRATYLAATLEPDELRRRMAALARGEYALAYAAPERLGFEGFRALLRDLECPLVAVDEAHCISEWGHDFRPEYLGIGALLKELPAARVLACTATATPVVRDEILERLGFDAQTPQLVHGFARPNLSLRVRECRGVRDRSRSVDAALTEALGAPGSAAGTAIVYAPTRRQTDETARRLGEAGWRTAAYHAGHDGRRRDAVQRSFASGELEVVVATNAFGMGIDRPDVRAVIHLAPPSSLEAYYQEVGRAGRDGAPALGLLLVSPGDMALRRRLIESDVDGRVPEPEVVRHKWNLFLELMRWAEGGSCRHDAVLRYFGDEAETLAGCGHCDVCAQLDAPEAHDPEGVALVARKALSAVARVHARFGLGVAVKLLRGAEDERLSRCGLDRTPTYGALAERSEEWLQRLLRRCVTAGWVDFHGGDRPVVVLTEEGAEVMRGQRPVRLLLPGRSTPAPGPGPAGGASRPQSAREHGAGDEALDAAGVALFEALRSHRLEAARARGVPPYVVASDRSLRDVARQRPHSDDELLACHGIGPARVREHGEWFLAVVRAHAKHDARDSQ
jgi:ATP-dependent DNA helicase RecQ